MVLVYVWKNMKTIIFSLLIVASSTLASFAETATDAAKVYFKLLQEKNFDKIGELYAPEALADFKGMMSFINEIPDEAAQVLPSLFGEGATKESVKALGDEEFFETFMKSIFNQLGAGEILFDNVDFLGEVPEGEVVHVLSRNNVSLGEIKVSQMEILSLKKVDDKWLLLLKGDMQGIAAQIKAGFGL